MSNPKAYLLGVDGQSFPDHKWDFGFLKETFEKNNIDYSECVSLPEEDRAFVVVCGYENRKLFNEINKEIAKIKRVVLFVTADERGVFRADKIVHPNIEIWIQSPYPDRHSQFNKFPIGAPSSLPEMIPTYPEKKYKMFFSGQITHQRRQELAENIGNVRGAFVNFTPGFTQGYSQKEYLGYMAESMIAPCPAGTSTIDSFRFYEALEMLAFPIADIRNSSGDIQDFWDFVFPNSPIYKTASWEPLPSMAKEIMESYPNNMHQVVAWWIKYKRDFAKKIMEQING